MIPLLSRIRARRVRGLADLDVVLPRRSGRPAPLVVTGPAASGKTRLIEAIIAAKEACAAYALHPDASTWFADPAGSIELVWEVGEAAGEKVTPWAPADPQRSQRIDEGLRTTLRAYSTDAARWKLEYLNAGRRLERGSPSSALSSPKAPAAAERVGTGRNKYDFVRGYLHGAAFMHAAGIVGAMEEQGLVIASEHGSALAGFAARLTQLTDKLLWLGVRSTDDRARCIFARRTGRGSQDIELSELSDSERMLVLFAATYEALGLSKSLLLVDTPELALHPEDQARVFEGLQAAMREGQLVVATSSPAILRSVPSDQVLILPSP